jgi:hypothetical protein
MRAAGGRRWARARVLAYRALYATPYTAAFYHAGFVPLLLFQARLLPVHCTSAYTCAVLPAMPLFIAAPACSRLWRRTVLLAAATVLCCVRYALR